MKLLFLLLLLTSKGASEEIRHLYLTFQNDPSTTVTLNIHGFDTSEELVVSYDLLPSGQSPKKVKGKPSCMLADGRRIYHVELKGLIPDSTYYFSVGGVKKAFRTLPNDPKTPLVFVEGGDWEMTKEAENLAKHAASLNPHAILLGGDYPSKVFSKRDIKKWDQWLDVFEKTMVRPDGTLIPVILALGNHEVVGGFNKAKSEAPLFFHLFRQAEKERSYFSLPLGPQTRLFVLDSGHAAPQGGSQRRWLENELQTYKNVPIKIALYHVPLYPSIRFSEKEAFYYSFYGLIHFFKGKAFASKLHCPQASVGKAEWLPLFDAYGLTVAFEHHDQALKRTKLLKADKSDPDGTLYLGDGAFGSETQPPPLQGYFRPYFANLQGGVHFFWLLRIDEERLYFEAQSVDGEVLDTFMLNR